MLPIDTTVSRARSIDNKKMPSSDSGGQMSRKDSGPAGPVHGGSRGNAPCSEQRRPPGLRKSDTPMSGCTGYPTHPYSRLVPIPLNNWRSPPNWPSFVASVVIPCPSIASPGYLRQRFCARSRRDVIIEIFSIFFSSLYIFFSLSICSTQI
jgi:hypothetical protein